MGEEQRIAYGRTLVDLVAHGRGGPLELLSCSTAMKEGEKTIQQRIRLLVNQPETRKTALFAAVAVMALAASASVPALAISALRTTFHA